MESTKKLAGQTALITGAGRGVGRGIALQFAAAGANLVLVARTESELKETADNCRKQEVSVNAQVLDLAQADQIEGLFEHLESVGITIDILVNNAAIMIKSLMQDYRRSEFEASLAVNVTAPMMLAQRAIVMMRRRRQGAIVNISSLSGCFGAEKFPGFGAYNISKYALWGLTEILAIENRDHGIRVNQLSLSAVDTRMFHEAAPPGLKPNLTVEQVARQVLYLASDDSYPLTGENIILTGMPPAR